MSASGFFASQASTSGLSASSVPMAEPGSLSAKRSVASSKAA